MASKSARELLASLEERLVLGEVSEKTYLELKAKYETQIAAESSPVVPSTGESSPDHPWSGEKGSSSKDVPQSGKDNSVENTTTGPSPRNRSAPFGDHSMDYSSQPSPGSESSSSFTPRSGSSAPFGVHSTEMPLAPGMEIGVEVPGKQIPRYQIGELLGKGGWGAVFRAEDRQYSPPRPVALKAIFTTATADKVALKRIEREARLGTELAHPNVVRIGDFSVDMGVYYLIMELVAGGDLNSLRADQPNERFTLDTALPLLKDIAEGLDYLHSKGIIHRDLKPSNLLWHPDEKRLKISDFGLAKTARDSILLSGAKMPSISGTDPYMAPEIWDAEDPSEAGDLYALGIIAYEMLKGDPPFRGPNFTHQHRNAPVKPIPDFPDTVNEALITVLAKQASDRYTSGHDFIFALEKPPVPKCPVCGEAKDVERFTCPECGKENLCVDHREEDGFCPDCHEKAVIAAEEERKRKEEEERKRKEEEERLRKEKEERKKSEEKESRRRLEEEQKRKLAEEERIKKENEERKRREAKTMQEWEEQEKRIAGEKARRQEEDRLQAEKKRVEREEEIQQLASKAMDYQEAKQKKNSSIFPLILVSIMIIIFAVIIRESMNERTASNRANRRTQQVTQQSREQQSRRQTPVQPQQRQPSAEEHLIDSLILIANNHMQSNRLSTPSDRNAYDTFCEILNLDSDNVQALDGIGQICERYIQLGDQARARNEWSDAIGFYQRSINCGENASNLNEKISECIELQQTPGIVCDGPLHGMSFSNIPGGRFMMGSPSSEYGRASNEKQHSVTVSSFQMMTTEVTQRMWEQIMGRSINDQRNLVDRSQPLCGVGNDYPVYYVSWDEAQEFIRRLNQRYPGNGFRLPTEAEWEFACRASTNTRFNTGNADMYLGQAGWYASNSDEMVHPVRNKQANAWGVYDMHGNVAEWCSDWYGIYPNSSVTNPQGPSSGTMRILRGGSWINSAGTCRSAGRSSNGPSSRYASTGFRLARSSR